MHLTIRRISPCLSLVGLAALLLSGPASSSPTRLVPELAARQLRFLVSGTTPAKVRREIDWIVGMGSRVPGYAGAEQAHKHVRNKMQTLRLHDVRTDTFAVEIPIDTGEGEILVSGTMGEQLRIWSLWPNGVRTSTVPPASVGGTLVYGGGGTWKELEGKPVQDSILLLDFASGQQWTNAASLGARAILFFDNGGVSRKQAAAKFLSVPIDMPRFWVEPEVADLLLRRIAEEEQKGTYPSARVQARLDWRTVPAYNVYGWLPGIDEPMPEGAGGLKKKWKDQVLVIQAYYDATSVVPGIAPGAESAAGIVAMLQMAEILVRHRPDYTILLLATSAHFAGRQGINDFLHRHRQKNDLIDFDLMLSLDLSSHTDRTVTLGAGTYYTPGWEAEEDAQATLAPFSFRLSQAVQEIFKDSLRHTDGVSASDSTRERLVPVPLALDAEAVTFLGGHGLAVVSANDARQFCDTPLDTADRVDFESLAAQIQTVTAMVMWAGKDPFLMGPARHELQDHGETVAGNIRHAAGNSGSEQILAPDALVTYQQPGPNSVAGVRSLVVGRTDSAGRFRFDVIGSRQPNRIEAYQIDAETGDINLAADRGPEGDRDDPVLFECQPLSFIESASDRSVVDDVTLLQVADGGEVETQRWGGESAAGATVVYAPPGSRVKIQMSSSDFDVPYQLVSAPAQWLQESDSAALIEAATIEHGYAVDQGVLLHPSLAALRDMWIQDGRRMRQLADWGIRSDAFMVVHQNNRQLLLDATAHLEARRYAEYDASVRQAWGLQARSYEEIKAVAQDTVFSVMYYLALLLS